MNKTNLKDLIQECVDEVRNENFIQQLEENLDQETQDLEESNHGRALQSLCESLDSDACALQEAHESGESLVAEGLITEEEIDEGFFDTLGQFGKNTFNSVAGAWKKAKAQGDEAEAKRLEKRLKDLKSGGAGKGGKEPGADNGAGKSQPVSMNTPPVKGGGKSVPSKAKAAPANKAKAKTGKGGKAAAKKVIIKKVKSAVIKKLERDDPEGAAKLKAIAKKNPKQLEKIKNNPKRKKQAKQLIAQIEQEKPEGGNQGFMAKVGSWMKKNPVKTGVAISLLSALATIAATSIGGPVAGAAANVAAGTIKRSAFDVDGNKTRYEPTIATGTHVSSGEMSDF